MPVSILENISLIEENITIIDREIADYEMQIEEHEKNKLNEEISTDEEAIATINNELEHVQQQLRDHKDEKLRLEGSMLVYKDIVSYGIEEIQLSPDAEKLKQEREAVLKAQDEANVDTATKIL